MESNCSLETEAQCDFALGRFLSRGDLARPRGKKGSACRTRVWPMWTEMLVLKLANPNSTRRKSFLNTYLGGVRCGSWSNPLKSAEVRWSKRGMMQATRPEAQGCSFSISESMISSPSWVVHFNCCFQCHFEHFVLQKFPLSLRRRRSMPTSRPKLNRWSVGLSRSQWLTPIVVHDFAQLARTGMCSLRKARSGAPLWGYWDPLFNELARLLQPDSRFLLPAQNFQFKKISVPQWKSKSRD